MKHLLLRNGWYFYDRRVPVCFSNVDPRKRVRLSLNTQCKRTAIRNLVTFNDQLENYWKGLVRKSQTHSNKKFDSLAKTARQMGFSYLSVDQCLSLPIVELVERVLTLKPHIQDEQKVKAILGDAVVPIKMSVALDRFWDYTKPKLINKNIDQQRKWKNSRIKAIKNFINHVGDKDINDLTNLDMVKFRDWWLIRLEQGKVKTNTINKDFTHLKDVIETVNVHEELNINIASIFKGIHLKETDKAQRSSYSTEFIREQILKPSVFEKLDKETQCLLLLSIQTGARPIELVNLDSNDIHLDTPTPYIHIRPRKGYSLKTKESERKIPLIGRALLAIQDFKNGFVRYNGNSELLSAIINNHLSRNNLRPTKKHSLYSFRHSFQDRLNALEVPDRLQCQLMGHKFHRPKYGHGASLEHLAELIRKADVLR